MNMPPPPPARQQVTISAGTAFKIGFFGFFGAVIASLILSVVFAILSLFLLLVGVNVWSSSN